MLDPFHDFKIAAGRRPEIERSPAALGRELDD